MSSMSHKNGTNTINGSFALESKESPLSINVGGHPPNKPSNKPVFGIQISTPICDEILTLIWVSLKTLNL